MNLGNRWLVAILVILAAGVLLTGGVVVYLVATREQEGDTSLVVPDSGEGATSMPEPIQITEGTTQTRFVDGTVREKMSAMPGWRPADILVRSAT